MALNRPNAISFSKKNPIHPFDSASTSQASLEFWASKNDASLFVVGQTTKKRPHGLTFVRMFDGRVLDMIEVGVEKWVGLADLKVPLDPLPFSRFNGISRSQTPKSTPGHKPMMHFASELFDTHPRFIQLKSMLLDFFNGEQIDEICLAGLGHVISITCAPTPSTLNNTSPSLYPLQHPSPPEDLGTLPKVHLRTYTTRLLASGARVPRVELTPMGPSMDFVLRRHQPADTEMMKQAMKKPKMKKQDVEKGLGKKRKNMEVDEMGDLRGRVHVGKQDLNKLQTRKMKGLKGGDVVEEVDGEAEEGRRGKKRRET